MIYLLEDDDSIRELVTYTLNSQGLDAEGFSHPREFWEAMRKAQPSLILLDIMLPEEDGITILQKLRAAPETKRVPVIMLTAKGSEYDTVRGLDSGADDYIPKPFRMMELLSRHPGHCCAAVRRKTAACPNTVLARCTFARGGTSSRWMAAISR